MPAETADNPPVRGVGGIRPLKTYLTDVQIAIERQQESIATIALAERRKREQEKASGGTENREVHKRILVIGITICAVLVVGGGVFAGIRYGKISFGIPQAIKDSVVKNVLTAPALIPPARERNVDAGTTSSLENLSTIIAQEKNIAQSAGSITNMFLTRQRSQELSDILNGTEIVSTASFLSTFLPSAPDGLKRSLDGGFMLGIYYDIAQKGHVFVVFKTNSFETSFAGMLSWEKALPQDMGLLLGSREGTGGFKDLVMRNKDTRAVVDRAREPVLLYSFTDRNTILIAPDKETFGNILDILNQPKSITQ